MRGNTTKERILREARRLFASHGYGAAGMDRIAEAVGIKAPSLYKHYESKEAILLAILEDMRARERESLAALGVLSESALSEGTLLDENAWREAVGERMALWLRDPDLTEGRRFLSTLSLCDERVAALRAEQMAHLVAHTEAILERLVRERVLRDGDGQVMALQLLSPLWMLTELCDAEPRREREVLALCEKHAVQFFRLYRRDAEAARERHTPLGRPMPVTLM